MRGRKIQNVTKPKHYPVDRTSDTREASKHKLQITSCMNELSNEFKTAETAQTQLNSVVKAIEEAAASSIGITSPNMPHEQKMLCLGIDNTQDAEMCNALKQKRNLIQHAFRRKALENASAKLDQNIEELERHAGAKMCKSVRLLYRTPHTKVKGKGSCFYIAQYPVLWTVQSALHVLPSLAELFSPTPIQRLREVIVRYSFIQLSQLSTYNPRSPEKNSSGPGRI